MMNHIYRKIELRSVLIILSLIVSSFAQTQNLKLGEIFNEGMVLQRDAKVAVWGMAAPLQSVTVVMLGKAHTTSSDKNGNWTVSLTPMKAGGPYEMQVFSGKQILKIKEVYVGEVWIAGGQSNMAFTLEKTAEGKKEIDSAKNKNIRFVLVPVVNYEGEKVRGDMNWRSATSEYVAPMSGVAYYFAKQLQEKLCVPVGVICCYKGGTAAEVWMSRETLLRNSNHAPVVISYENYMQNLGKEKYEQMYDDYERRLKIYFDSVRAGYKIIRPVEPMGDKHYKRPYGLYYTMLKRITPYTSKGIIWYQGEANAPRAEQYRTLFPALIDEWRHDFKNSRMPFLFVQLSNYDHPAYGANPNWAELREAQLMTWQNVKNTAMVVSIDVGNKKNIHPVDKKPVGERLAACALNRIYKQKIPYSGPVCKSIKIRGTQIELSFDFVYGGLKSEGSLKGFTICGKDKKFVPAIAVIRANRIFVSAAGVEKPVAVRYGWSNWSEGNLTNSEGFPATPFRTDDYEMITKGLKEINY